MQISLQWRLRHSGASHSATAVSPGTLIMGQSISNELPKSSPAERQLAHVNAVADRALPEIDKFALKHIRDLDDEQIFDKLGINGSVGSVVLKRSAVFIASYPLSMTSQHSISPNVAKVISFYNGKLSKALKLTEDQVRKVLFLSIAVQAVSKAEEFISPGDVEVSKYYIAYDDLNNLFQLLVAVYDKRPTEKFTIEQGKVVKDTVALMLEPFKGPIIDFDTFSLILLRYQPILRSFAIIWDQLLYDTPVQDQPKDAHSDVPANQNHAALMLAQNHMDPDVLCQLYMVMGSKISSSIRLYDAREDGFSMRAFESKVINWKAPSLLIIKGKRLTKRVDDLERHIPVLSDSSSRTSKRVKFAIYLDTPWRVSAKHGFGGRNATIYQLSPNFNIFKVKPRTESGIAYFAPSIGMGFGLAPPQTETIRFTRESNISLILDRFLEYGVFRCIDDDGAFSIDDAMRDVKTPYEDRFSITGIQAWGMGSKDILDAQKRDWEWERREAMRRQNVNFGEDRALLEMAGLVGRYDANRGTT